MQNKLYRSQSDRWIAGVCGGLGQYLGVDSTFVRLFFILLAFANGIGFLIYLVMAILLPLAPAGMEDMQPAAPLMHNPQAAYLIGGTLVVLGLFYFIDNLNLPWLSWLDLGLVWPLLLIVGGAVLIFRVVRRSV